jgi:hypothetical protein
MQEDYASDIARASLQDSCCHLLRLSSARLQQTWRLETNESVALRACKSEQEENFERRKMWTLAFTVEEKASKSIWTNTVDDEIWLWLMLIYCERKTLLFTKKYR